MIAIILSLVAVAAAAPHYDHRSHFHNLIERPMPTLPPPIVVHHFDNDEFMKELESELRQVDEAMKEATGQLPVKTSLNEGDEGNECKLTMELTGFEEKDIKVKAMKDVLIVQAVHYKNEGNQHSYTGKWKLPSNINIAGSWTYKNNELKIVFPLNKKTDEEVTADVHQEEHVVDPGSLEEIKEHGNENVDEEVETNERSKNEIEAIHIIDLKNVVEFVPVET